MTFSEENYLKTIYHLTTLLDTEVSTNAIAEKIETKASSVTDMLKKLADKNLIHYKKYQGVSLTPDGLLAAKMIVRKHRLWEVFLVEKLDFPVGRGARHRRAARAHPIGQIDQQAR